MSFRNIQNVIRVINMMYISHKKRKIPAFSFDVVQYTMNAPRHSKEEENQPTEECKSDTELKKKKKKKKTLDIRFKDEKF